MLYREIPPRPRLAPWVHTFWVLEHDPGPSPPPEKIVPDGRTEVIFRFGAPYRWRNGADRAQEPTCIVVGQLRRHIELFPTGPVAMLGVRLEPAAMHRLVGADLHELTDGHCGADELGLRDLRELDEELHGAATWRRRIELVESALERRFLTDPRATLGSSAASLIVLAKGKLDVAEVARRHGVSTRTLERRFASEVGLAPKLFSRQVRLQNALTLLGETPRPGWSDVALACGCFDQAHLVREFRAIAGEPPESFVLAGHELSDHMTGLATG